MKWHAMASPETRAHFLVEKNAHCNATQNAVAIWPGWLLPDTACIVRASSPMEGVGHYLITRFLRDVQERVTFRPFALF